MGFTFVEGCAILYVWSRVSWWRRVALLCRAACSERAHSAADTCIRGRSRCLALTGYGDKGTLPVRELSVLSGILCRPLYLSREEGALRRFGKKRTSAARNMRRACILIHSLNGSYT